MTPLKPGMTGKAELTVGPEHTAESVGCSKVGVLATPVMINVIEVAALAAIDPHLSEGHQSLGTFSASLPHCRDACRHARDGNG